MPCGCILLKMRCYFGKELKDIRHHNHSCHRFLQTTNTGVRENLYLFQRKISLLGEKYDTD